jgi:hypothetical protein
LRLNEVQDGQRRGAARERSKIVRGRLLATLDRRQERDFQGDQLHGSGNEAAEMAAMAVMAERRRSR